MTSTTWHNTHAVEQAFTRATLRRAASAQERLFYDAFDPSVKAKAGRRRSALVAAADHLSSETPATTYTGTGSLTDSQAVERIGRWLQDADWGVGMLEDIAEVIRATGRNCTGTGQPTWLRH